MKFKKIFKPLAYKINGITPRIILLKLFGYLAIGERYRPNPFFLTLDAIKSDYNCIIGSNTKLPFSGESIRVVYTSHNIEHYPDAVANLFFSEVHRILKPGGELLIEVPDCKFYYEAFADYLFSDNADRIKKLTDFSFDSSVIANIRQAQPNADITLVNDIRTKFGLAISCYCSPSFIGAHTPVLINNQEFDEAFKDLSMDNFFEWLINKQSKEQLKSGGHCSAWYPDKIVSSLEKAGFQVRARGYKDSRHLTKMLVPDRRHRSFGSLRVSAIKI